MKIIERPSAIMIINILNLLQSYITNTFMHKNKQTKHCLAITESMNHTLDQK